MDIGKKRPALSLSKLRISPAAPATTGPTGAPANNLKEEEEYDFSDVFGHEHPGPNPSSSKSPIGRLLIEIIHARSHSLVGPSPRLIHSSSFKDEAPTSVPPVDEEKSSDEEVEEEEERSKEECYKLGPSDFEILRLVGRGAFGKVFLVRKKGKGIDEGEGKETEIFAMKVMRKETIIKKNHVEYMRAERDILTKITHPFIVQLRYSFQTRSKLYLILDFINGGHLFFHLYRQGLFRPGEVLRRRDNLRRFAPPPQRNRSPRSEARECSDGCRRPRKDAESVAFRLRMAKNLIFELILQVMLTDFGLAKEINESDRSNSLCGTTEYMAPEILLSKGHNKDADWWSIGILVYEMLTGQPPFTHQNRKKLQQKIISENVKLPPYLSSEAHSLLKGLLQKDPAKRLGSGPGGEDQVKKHKWFRQIIWSKVEARELMPKFKPDVGGADCTANFDKCWTSEPPDDSPAPTPTTPGDHFRGFSYVAPRNQS